MLVTIELKTGPKHSDRATKKDVQRNIDALKKAIRVLPSSSVDTTSLLDTRSILEAIQRELPNE